MISRTFLEQLVLVNLIPVPGRRRWCLVSANLTGEGSSCQLLPNQPFSFLQRAIFVNNVMRIKSCVVSILDFVQFIKSCLEWENPVRYFFYYNFLPLLLCLAVVRSVISFVVFMTITWYFEPYMVPVGLLLIFLKQYIVASYIEKPSRELSPTLEEEEEEHEEPDNKEEKMSLKERLQAVQDVTAMVQNALGEVAGMAESIKNTFNFSVPFLSWLGIIILLVVAIFLYFIPCR